MSTLELRMEGRRLKNDYPVLLNFIRGFWNIGMVEEGSMLPPFVDRYFPSLPKDWAENFVEQAASARTDEALHAFFAENSKARDCVNWMWDVCYLEPEDFTTIHAAALRNYEAGNWRQDKPQTARAAAPFPRRRGRR